MTFDLKCKLICDVQVNKLVERTLYSTPLCIQFQSVAWWSIWVATHVLYARACGLPRSVGITNALFLYPAFT